ncbi:hypothetical protein K466DRAFT_665650 [Polyporus arcularius HHB13444]|uniref:Protein kinase domain-containing protein n=1 Tax=Polyporus arcularius HHB13444 TaxID=1314778 RepID=A0A5C3P358_9APHY|nr:hypothetical protein K466DRAFT_665650 [Polyporus arcularius HHB13444]
MSRLYWPQSTSPRRTWDADAPLTFHTLLPISSAPEPQKPCFAYITNKIAETEFGDLEVVRATLQFGLDCYEEPTSQLSVSGTKGKVVCKVAHDELMLHELKEEANLYAGLLAPLQGTVVPKCYGYFVGHSRDGVIGVLVTEDCGSPPWSELKGCPKDFKLAALEALVHLHRVGVKHGDFMRRNIVTRGKHDVKSLRLLNFQHAREHKCRCAAKPIDMTKAPSWGDIPCGELYEAFMKVKPWL